MVNKYALGITLVLVFLSAFAFAQAEEVNAPPEEKAFIVREYRYEPPTADSPHQEIGLSLCGTRCNALSHRFDSYIKPRGWRLIKTAADVEQPVELENPFLKGKCVCLGDEYSIDWFDPVAPENRAGAAVKRSE